ncbi:MAG TPA: NUDIX domain-containing protein, partial [Desulfobulbus sp.]|nr:NUDIX domain-containing protein [Desulfobulbus sp.]
MYTPIIGTLGYILSPDRDHVLLVHRNARPQDQHLGKYNGLGGKMKPDEDVVACMEREILEEAGIRCREMRLRGTVNWTGFGPRGEDWLGF